MSASDGVSVSVEVEVEPDPDPVFAVFTEELDTWWGRGPNAPAFRQEETIDE